MITQDEYYACIKGYQIIDCVVLNKDYFHFVGRNVKEEDITSRAERIRSGIWRAKAGAR